MDDRSTSAGLPNSLNLGSLYALAHELIDPLTVVTSSAEIMASQQLPEPLMRIAENIRRKSRYCQAVSMVLLGRDPAADRPPESFDVPAVIAKVALLGNDIAGSENAVTQDPVESLLASGDAVLLECALSNLVRNALQTGKKKCRVKISARAHEGRVEIDTADNGPGVPVEIRERLFERGISGKKRGSGSGLGLWLSRSLLEAYGGQISLIDTGAGGSTFRISIPAAPSRSRDGTAPRREARPLPAPMRKGLQVLIVEDDPEVSSVISEALSLFGNEPAVARSVEEAEEKLEAGAEMFDAVTLDLGLGAASGLDLLTAIARRWPDLARRVVLCSAAPRDLAERVPPGLAPQLLRKPFEMKQLLAAVNKAAAKR